MTPQELDDVARQVRERFPSAPSAPNVLYMVEEGTCPICGVLVHYRLVGRQRQGIENPDGQPHACAAA